MGEITDTDRINWLAKGHCLMALSDQTDKKGIKFRADFERQGWSEFNNVREAIDFAMKQEQEEKTS